jgi:hypothetical protein
VAQWIKSIKNAMTPLGIELATFLSLSFRQIKSQEYFFEAKGRQHYISKPL